MCLADMSFLVTTGSGRALLIFFNHIIRVNKPLEMGAGQMDRQANLRDTFCIKRICICLLKMTLHTTEFFTPPL